MVNTTTSRSGFKVPNAKPIESVHARRRHSHFPCRRVRSRSTLR